MALMTAQEYIESLRKLNTRVYMFGEKIENWVDHPMIRPVLDLLAEHIDAGVQLPQGLNVFLGGHQCHFLLSS